MFEPFFDETIGQEIIEVTNGALVSYRGQQFYMHCERPTLEILSIFSVEAAGIANILIGQTLLWPVNPERGALITVDGDDWVIGDWSTGNDGEVMYLALTRSNRR